LLAAGGEPAGGVGGLVEELLGLLEVDDVDAVALHEDVRGHLRIPSAREVPEVGAGTEEVFDLYAGHGGGGGLRSRPRRRARPVIPRRLRLAWDTHRGIGRGVGWGSGSNLRGPVGSTGPRPSHLGRRKRLSAS